MMLIDIHQYATNKNKTFIRIYLQIFSLFYTNWDFPAKNYFEGVNILLHSRNMDGRKNVALPSYYSSRFSSKIDMHWSWLRLSLRMFMNIRKTVSVQESHPVYHLNALYKRLSVFNYVNDIKSVKNLDMSIGQGIL